MIAAPLEFQASPATPEVPLADLGEGPCWDPDRQCLSWVDIPAGIAHQLAGHAHATLQVGQPVGAVAVRGQGGLILAARDGFPALADCGGNRMNDTGRVDVLDYGPATGTGGNRRPFAELPSGQAVPDGLAVDADPEVEMTHRAGPSA